VVNGTLGVLLIAGAGYGYLSLADDGNASTPATQTGTVARGTVLSSVSASGSVESAKSQDLSFGTSGTVKKIEVQTGDKVVKGEVLARLDDTTARENVTVTKASLDAASASTSTVQTYSAYVTAKNAYNAALRQLDGTVLKAPFAGTVTAVNGTVGGSSGGSSSSSSSSSSTSSGSTAGGGGGAGGAGGGGAASGSSGGSSGSSTGSSSSSGFITVADTGKLAVTGNFTEADTTKLKIGQPATITFDALTGVTAAGKVAAIDMSSTTTNNVVQYGVTISLTSKPAGLRLGQTTSVQVTVSKAADVLYVPTAAVRTVGGQSTVTILQNGKQVIKTVEIGVKGDQGTEIKSGLTLGDRVVLASATGTGGVQLPGGGRFPGGLGGGAGGGLGGGGARTGGGGRG
jgi:membrane fusion protein, macrolide-specific efflux system